MCCSYQKRNPVLSACTISSPISSIIIVIADLRLTGLYIEILTLSNENYEMCDAKDFFLNLYDTQLI